MGVMERPRQSTIAIGLIGAGITAYELFCNNDELLTNRTGELLRNPNTRLLTPGMIGATALHLLQLMPSSVDPYHYAGKLRVFTRPDELE